MCFSACLFNLNGSKQVKGLNWVVFAWILNHDVALAPYRPAEGLEGLKYRHQGYEHQCLSLDFKDWDQRTAQAVDVSWEQWEGSIIRNTRFYLAATWADHLQLDKFTCTHSKFYCILSNIGHIMYYLHIFENINIHLVILCNIW